MKFPGIPGADILDFKTPTRRKFIQMGVAVVLPKPPIDIGSILKGDHGILPMPKFPSPRMSFELGKFGFHDVAKIREFITRYTPGFHPENGEYSYHYELDKIMKGVVNNDSEAKNAFIEKWKEKLGEDIGNENLQYLFEKREVVLEIFGDFGDFPDPIGSGIIEEPKDILNMLGGKMTVCMQDIDDDIEDMEIVIEMSKNRKIKFNTRVTMGGDYDIYDEYNDIPNYMSLDDFKGWINRKFVGFSDEIECRFPGARKLQLRQKELEKEWQIEKENKQLPVTLEVQKEMDFYRDIVSGKICPMEEVNGIYQLTSEIIERSRALGQ